VITPQQKLQMNDRFSLRAFHAHGENNGHEDDKETAFRCFVLFE
jgi:hypothetical protein